VEVDGSQHYSNEGIAYDKKRDEFLCTQGFRILRFNAVEVLSNTDGIVEVILDNIKNPLQSPYEGDS
jgi:very-short-patch-repair endonuclease